MDDENDDEVDFPLSPMAPRPPLSPTHPSPPPPSLSQRPSFSRRDHSIDISDMKFSDTSVRRMKRFTKMIDMNMMDLERPLEDMDGATSSRDPPSSGMSSSSSPPIHRAHSVSSQPQPQSHPHLHPPPQQAGRSPRTPLPSPSSPLPSPSSPLPSPSSPLSTPSAVPTPSSPLLSASRMSSKDPRPSASSPKVSRQFASQRKQIRSTSFQMLPNRPPADLPSPGRNSLAETDNVTFPNSTSLPPLSSDSEAQVTVGMGGTIPQYVTHLS